MSSQLMRNSLRFGVGVLARRPFQVLVQVTNRCNMSCDFCDFWPNGVPLHRELSTEDYESLSEQLAKIGSFIVSIEGGEPLLRPDLISIVRAFSRRHLPLLYTNGRLMTRELARELFAADVAQVGVSIDFPDAKRHDAKRVSPGAFDNAWRAVEYLKEFAPRPDRQVHIMSVLMEENQDDLENLLKLSRDAGVGHCLTMVSLDGFRRNGERTGLPGTGISARLMELWNKYPHFRMFRDYLEKADAFLAGSGLPTCEAGVQSFNIDHIGQVSPCIEKINNPAGNIQEEPLEDILIRLRDMDAGRNCQECWSLCRGFQQALAGGGGLRSIKDLSTRMRSV